MVICTFFICEKEKEQKKSYLYKEELLKGNTRNMIRKNIIIQNKNQFLSKNMDQRFQKLHETYLTHQEQDILIDFMYCDMNISKVAAKHHLHRYQIYHMFDEIREKTKLDPRCFYDLETLHMELERRKNDE